MIRPLTEEKRMDTSFMLLKKASPVNSDEDEYPIKEITFDRIGAEGRF